MRTLLISSLVLVAVGTAALATIDRDRAEAAGTADGLRFVRFEVNRGQLSSDVDFVARAAGFRAYLTGNGPVFALPAGRTSAGHVPASSVTMRFLNAARVEPVGEEQLASYSNYLRGRDSTKWQRNVAHFSRVVYRQIYPGIDLVYSGGARFEYDFVVHPGADPRQIRFQVEGAERLQVARDGGLVATLPNGVDHLVQRAPTVYQERAAHRTPVAGRFQLLGSNVVSFELGAYDDARPLVIDPVVLGYSTYLGGSRNETVRAVAVDNSNMAYVVGLTRSTDFPVQGAIQGTIKQDEWDAYVVKINPNQTGAASLVYATYLGSTDRDEAFDVAVTAQGEAVVAGYTQGADFPVTPTGFKPLWMPNPAHNGDEEDGFVVVLNAQGNGLVYGTFFGGNNDDIVTDIALAGSGVLYMAGESNTGGFPTTSSAFDATGQLGSIFVSVLNWQTNVLQYSTFFHATGNTYARGLSVGATGVAHIVGITGTAGLPTRNGFQNTLPNGTAGGPGLGGSFYAAFDPSQNGNASLIYATYLGPADAEDVAVHDGKAIVTGRTNSKSFPTTTGAFDVTCEDFVINGQNLGCIGDAFVTKIDPGAAGATSLIFSTRLGGVRTEGGKAILAEPAGTIYLTGSTGSDDFPTAGAVSSSPAPGTDDAFVASFNAAGSALSFSTRLGGRTGTTATVKGSDWGTAIARAPDGSIYVAGETDATDFPIVGGFDTSVGLSDGFFIKLADQPSFLIPVVVLILLVLILLVFWNQIRILVAGPVVPKIPGPPPVER